MKKQLLSLAVLATLGLSFDAFAEATLTEVWKTRTTELNDDWDPTSPDWSNPDAIKSTTCARFATGKDGRIYTINMKTMSIAEISKDGVTDLYKLPSLEGRRFADVDGKQVDDYYGSAISMDEAGNFLIGHYFVKPELCSRIWTVYQPSTGKYKHFDIGYPSGYDRETFTDGGITANTGIGRTDVVGRVAGDFSEEAIFYIAPQGQKGSGAQNIRLVYGYAGGNFDDLSLDCDEFAPTYLGGTNVDNIVQPVITDMATFGETFGEHMSYYVLCSCSVSEWDMIGTYWTASEEVRKSCTNFQTAIREAAKTNPKVGVSPLNGFDTFVIDGHRYFVRNYSTNYANNARCMDIAVYDENGEVVATWVNTDYSSTMGYGSITAQPQEDGTALLHIYNSTSKNTSWGDQKCVAAAVIKFTPADAAGIDDVNVENNNAPAVYYNLQGVEVANPENGVYVV
ncbi:MAG: hypothetical protein K2J10_11255, partial [Muribaculaceae bacterium]|nr:hypothetical protein [Muribaculaceae bacterium]